MNVEAAVAKDVPQFLVTSVITIATEYVTCSIVMLSRPLVAEPGCSTAAICVVMSVFTLCLGVRF